MKLFYCILCWLSIAFATQAQQYCVANLHQNVCGANGTSFVDTLYAIGQPFAPRFVKTCANNAPAYVSMLADTNNTLQLIQGDSITLYLRVLGQVSASLWIDYNHNGNFEASEWIDLGRNLNIGPAVRIRFGVSFLSTLGKTRMRVRTRVAGGINTAIDGCSRFLSGMTYDLNANVLAGIQCTSLPNSILTSQSQTLLCAGDSTVISLSTPTTAGGISLEWQSSTGAGYAPINGANRLQYVLYFSALATDSLWVRLKMTCSATGDSLFSAPIMVKKQSARFCYCTANLHAATCDPAYLPDSLTIENSLFLPIMPKVCNGTYYRFGTAPYEVAQLQQGGLYTIDYKAGTNHNTSGFIDYNANGVFEATEWFDLGRNALPGQITTGSFIVPATATLGRVGMRIRIRGQGAPNGPSDACATFRSGITMDFQAEISPGTGCQLSQANGVIIADADSVCAGDSVVVRMGTLPSGVGLYYEWYTSTDTLNWVHDTRQTGLTYSVRGTSLTDSVYVQLGIACSATGQTIRSNWVKVFKRVNPMCYCWGVNNNNQCAGYLGTVTIATTQLNIRLNNCPQGRTFYNFPVSNTTTALLAPSTVYYLTVVHNGNANANGSAWVDYNQNGSFDANEYILLNAQMTPGQVFRVAMNVPATAKLGRTYMRLRTRGLPSQNGAGDACTQFNSGVTYTIPITIVPTPVGLGSTTRAELLQVFPNPASQQLTVQTTEELQTIKVQNAQGKVVLTTPASGQNQTIGLNKLAPGVYMLVAETTTGTLMQRVVIE